MKKLIVFLLVAIAALLAASIVPAYAGGRPAYGHAPAGGAAYSRPHGGGPVYGHAYAGGPVYSRGYPVYGSRPYGYGHGPGYGYGYPAYGHRYYGHGPGYGYGYPAYGYGYRGGFYGSVYIGPGWWGAPYYPYPYYYPYYADPPVVIQQQAPTYEYEQAPAQEQTYYWYFCPDSNAYYPYVKQCPGGWKKVVPKPPDKGRE